MEVTLKGGLEAWRDKWREISRTTGYTVDDLESNVLRGRLAWNTYWNHWCWDCSIIEVPERLCEI